MNTDALLPILAFGTLAAVAVFGYRSAVKSQERLDSNKRKSTLAADAPDTVPPGEKPVDT